MRCLSPISVKNPRYRVIPFSSERVDSDGVVHERIDDTQLLVPCGTCFACLRNKRNSIAFRLYQEYLSSGEAFFITLTVSDENMPLFENNAKAQFRKWFEHLRYKTGESPRHWIVSELGKRTKRLHFHGIIFKPQFSAEELSKLWPYGFSYVGYCNERTISYIVKYITKPQLEKEDYEPFVLQSNRPGIGSSFLTPSRINQFRNTEDFTVYFNRARITLPRYYYEKIFNEDERRSRAVEYQKQLLDNPFSYVFDLLLKSKQPDLYSYIDSLRQHYINTIELGMSKPKKKQFCSILNDYGTFTTDNDSTTTKRVEF